MSHLHGPEREETHGDNPEDDGSPGNVVVPGGGVVQPDIGVIPVQEDLIVVHLQPDLALLLLLFFLLLLEITLS